MRTLELTDLVGIGTTFGTQRYARAMRLVVDVRDEGVATKQRSGSIVYNHKALKPLRRCLGHLQSMQQSCFATGRCRGERALQPRDMLQVDGVEPQARERPRLMEFDEPSLRCRLLFRPRRCLSPPGLFSILPLVQAGGVLAEACDPHLRAQLALGHGIARAPRVRGPRLYVAFGNLQRAVGHLRNPLEGKGRRGFLALPFFRNPNELSDLRSSFCTLFPLRFSFSGVGIRVGI